MINKNLAVLVSVLILMVSLMVVFNFSTETDTETVIEGDNTVTDDDVIDEIDIALLEEDSEVDIGEMI
jgi:hypothetical protein